MDKLIKRIAASLLFVTAIAGAQSWNDSQGSGILRVGSLATQDPYARPGIFFLGRAERVLPPPYSFVYPFTIVRTSGSSRYLVREYRPSEQSGPTILAKAQRRR